MRQISRALPPVDSQHGTPKFHNHCVSSSLPLPHRSLYFLFSPSLAREIISHVAWLGLIRIESLQSTWAPLSLEMKGSVKFKCHVDRKQTRPHNARRQMAVGALKLNLIRSVILSPNVGLFKSARCRQISSELYAASQIYWIAFDLLFHESHIERCIGGRRRTNLFNCALLHTAQNVRRYNLQRLDTYNITNRNVENLKTARNRYND